jgi:hypothetical protein
MASDALTVATRCSSFGKNSMLYCAFQRLVCAVVRESEMTNVLKRLFTPLSHARTTGGHVCDE